MSYQTQDVSAVSPDDYAATSGVLTIPAGAISGIISVAIVDDSLDEPAETFDLTLSAPVNAVLGAPSTVTGTIIDDDDLLVSVDDVSVDEDAGTATFTVSLNELAAADVMVDIVSSDGTATAGLDYTAVPLTQLTIPMGTLSVTQDVTILDDGDTEGNETFTMTLSNPSANADLGDAVGVGTIRDDEVSACGEPSINLAVDREAFLWQDCTSGVWSARFTAGGTFTIYEGTVDSDLGFTSVTPFSLEGTDTLNIGANQIFFNVRMAQNYSDGFDFTVPAGSNVCVGLDLPPGTDVLVGVLRTPVAVPFDPVTLGPCQ